MKLAWSKLAFADLAGLRNYIRLENPRAAAMVADRIEATTKKLTRFPNLGRQGELPGTRELAVSGLPYLIVYRLRDDTVDLLRVFHMSRDWPGSMQ